MVRGSKPLAMVRILPSLPQDSDMQTNETDPETNPSKALLLPQARSNGAIEDAIAALRGNGERPVEFVLLASSDGIQLTPISSDGLRHAEEILLSENFKETFVREQGRRRISPHSVPGSNQMDDRRQSCSSDSSASRNSHRRRRNSRQVYDPGDSGCGTKRRRPCSGISEDNTPVAPQVISTKSFMIGDDVEVDKYLYQNLRDFQQNPCKGLAKASIKTIEPKKQTNYPYTGGNTTVPPWWPRVPLESEEKTGAPGCVRHKEPDHQYKGERIQLIVHIMRVVADPHHPQRTATMAQLTIKELEKACFESMATLFNDEKVSSTMRARKKQTFKEFFRVLKLVERYKDGGLDAGSIVTVRHGDDPVEDTDLGGDSQFKNEDEDGSQGMPTPESIVSDQVQTPVPSRHQQMESGDYSLPIHNRVWHMEDPRYAGHGPPPLQPHQQFIQNGYSHTAAASDQGHTRRGSVWSPPFGSTPQYSNWAPPHNMEPTSSMAYGNFAQTHQPPENFAPVANHFHPGHPQLPLPPPGIGHRPLHPQFDHESQVRNASITHAQFHPDFINDSDYPNNVDHQLKVEHRLPQH